MYREVYFSPEAKLYERILQKSVERLLEEGKINVNDLWEMKDYELEEMLKDTEYYEMLEKNWIKIGEIEEISDKFSNPFELSKKEKEIAEILNSEENEILCVFIPSSSKLRTDDVFLCYDNTWFLEKHKELAKALPKEANKLLVFTRK